MDTKASPLEFLASFVLPESILDWFEVIKAEEKAVNPSEKDKYQAELHLSEFPEWDQLDHASSWILKPENIGENLSIDETSLHDDLFTFLSNKAGHCRQWNVS